MMGNGTCLMRGEERRGKEKGYIYIYIYIYIKSRVKGAVKKKT